MRYSHGDASPPQLLRGNSIFASRGQVEKYMLFEHFPNARCVVQCTDSHTGFRYPGKKYTSLSQHFRIDPVDTRNRQQQLEDALPLVRATLSEGNDVIIHCHASFHRAPIVGAALYQRLTSVSAKARSKYSW